MKAPFFILLFLSVISCLSNATENTAINNHQKEIASNEERIDEYMSLPPIQWPKRLEKQGIPAMLKLAKPCDPQNFNENHYAVIDSTEKKWKLSFNHQSGCCEKHKGRAAINQDSLFFYIRTVPSEEACECHCSYDYIFKFQANSSIKHWFINDHPIQFSNPMSSTHRKGIDEH